MFIKDIDAQPDDNQACRIRFSTEHLSLSHVSNVTLISVYVVNGYVSRRSAVTDKSDIISGYSHF